jgi:cell division protein FtsW (lipid II flippase)
MAGWLLFGGSSLTAVATGCWIASQHGVPHRVLLMNAAAWIVGAALAAAVSRMPVKRWWWLALALVGLASTFLSAGVSGVHRWIGLGPIRLNGAELLLPPAVMAGSDILLPLAILILLALQPDASQAIAFGGGLIVAMATSDASRRRRVWTILLFAVVAALSLLRHDPLAPVPEVEGIIGLASPGIAAIALLALVGTTFAPLLVSRSSAAYALTAYLALSALAPVFGAFPVSLVGMGVSPILGAWLGFGALTRSIRT